VADLPNAPLIDVGLRTLDIEVVAIHRGRDDSFEGGRCLHVLAHRMSPVARLDRFVLYLGDCIDCDALRLLGVRGSEIGINGDD
jgi:hypothetical protein